MRHRCISGGPRDNFTSRKRSVARSDRQASKENIQKVPKDNCGQSERVALSHGHKKPLNQDLYPRSQQGLEQWIMNDETEPARTVGPSRLVQVENEKLQFVAFLPTVKLYDKLVNALLDNNALKAAETKLHDLDSESNELAHHAKCLDQEALTATHCWTDNGSVNL